MLLVLCLGIKKCLLFAANTAETEMKPFWNANRIKITYVRIETIFPNEIHCFQYNRFVLVGFYHLCESLESLLKIQKKLARFHFLKIFKQT